MEMGDGRDWRKGSAKPNFAQKGSQTFDQVVRTARERLGTTLAWDVAAARRRSERKTSREPAGAAAKAASVGR
jgi:hypothetical protein